MDFFVDVVIEYFRYKMLGAGVTVCWFKGGGLVVVLMGSESFWRGGGNGFFF